MSYTTWSVRQSPKEIEGFANELGSALGRRISNVTLADLLFKYQLEIVNLIQALEGEMVPTAQQKEKVSA